MQQKKSFMTHGEYVESYNRIMQEISGRVVDMTYKEQRTLAMKMAIEFGMSVVAIQNYFTKKGTNYETAIKILDYLKQNN